jgi:GTP cyclohydrolase III
MQGWIYKTPLKRAIEATHRQGSGKIAKPAPGATLAESPPAVTFLPVRFAQATVTRHPADHAAIEVVLGGGRRLAIRPGFDEETLRRVVVALESEPC